MTISMFASTGPERREVPLNLYTGPRLTIIDRWLSSNSARDLLAEVMRDTTWNHVPVVMAGREVMQPRLTASCGDAGLLYRYSGTVNQANHWTAALAVVRDKVATETGELPNFVLLNLYRDGQDSIGWHADDERDLGENSTIAAVNLGATRRFLVKSKAGGKSIGTDLHDGTLCTIAGTFQQHYLHSIAKEPGAGLRVSLTFRSVLQ